MSFLFQTGWLLTIPRGDLVAFFARISGQASPLGARSTMWYTDVSRF